MNLALSEDQVMIRDAAESFLADVSDSAVVRRAMDSALGTMGSGIFVGNVCHATAVSVAVRWDQATRKAMPLSDAEKALLRPWLASNAGPA